MMEAMASQNAIITRNVGQTELMVTDEYNGIYIQPDTPQGLADAMEKFMKMSVAERHLMQLNSKKVVDEKHTLQNFIVQIESFWTDVLEKS